MLTFAKCDWLNERNSAAMRMIIASAAAVADDRIRQGVLSAGLECGAEDCVPYAELAVRLAKAPADVVLVTFDADPAIALQTIENLVGRSKTPVLAAGPVTDSAQVLRALRCGAREYLDAARLRDDLLQALEKLRLAQAVPFRRGRIVGVLAALPGTGVTTIGSGIAFALAELYPKQVALIELSAGVPELALDLDLQPRHTFADLVACLDRLDATLARQTLVEHPSGVYLLAHKPETLQAPPLPPEAARQTLVLLRTMFDHCVLDLGHHADATCLECLDLADEFILVVRQDVPSLRRSRYLLRELADTGLAMEKLRLVANRYGQRGELPWKKVEETLGRPVLEWIPDDPASVNEARNRGQPLLGVARRAPIARAFAKLAASLMVSTTPEVKS
jgi:pilus assembly protein CpaE